MVAEVTVHEDLHRPRIEPAVSMASRGLGEEFTAAFQRRSFRATEQHLPVPHARGQPTFRKRLCI